MPGAAGATEEDIPLRSGGTPARWQSNLTLLVAGNGISSLGNAVYLVAAVLYLKDITDSALLLGLFQFLALIPGFILSPLSGSLIDRWSRRNVLIATDILRGVLMIAAGLLLVIGFGHAPAVLLTLSFAAGLGHAFFVPAAQALIPEIVPPSHLSSANALRTGGSQLFNMTGNAVGGVLFVVLGAPVVLILNGVTFLVSAVQELWIVVPHRQRAGKATPLTAETLRRDVATVIRYLRDAPVIRGRIIAQAGMFLLSPVFLLTLPFVLIDELGTGEQVLGYIFAASLAGGIGVFVALSRLSTDRLVALPVAAIAYAVFGLVCAALAVERSLPVLAVGAVLAGGAAAAVYLSATVRIQHSAPTEMHGRLFAVMEAAAAGVAPFAYLATGWALDRLGIDRISVLYVAAALPALLWALRLATVERGSRVHDADTGDKRGTDR
ncbi:MAG: MFS transporter [Spirochaeta sp.]|nr:MFS transporter [Spirochaeta sp.]